MRIRIIHRKKTIHAGILGIDSKIFSVCRGSWYLKDKVELKDVNSEKIVVTCSVCKKYVEEALNNNGYVYIKRKTNKSFSRKLNSI